MRNNLIELEQIKFAYETEYKSVSKRITVCAGTGCVANGALIIYEELKHKISQQGIDIQVELKYENNSSDFVYLSESGCQGFCQMGPLVNIEPEGILYMQVKQRDIESIIERTIKNNEVIEKLLFKDINTGQLCKGRKEISFYNKQSRIVLEECGKLAPSDINEYIAHNGYSGAKQAFTELSSEEVCEIIKLSGLRGRGGGGFMTGVKWEFARKNESDKKYIICNGDEGDPGAFMDRSLMEGNPHTVIEGMMIAARAIGAEEGYIYVRTEYPLAVSRVKQAVKTAEKMGLLGDNVFGSGFSFRIIVMEGAGAFVCGEETALISSVEGKRGMPMPKPPFPAQSGLNGKPTVINNVETLAMVPYILRNGHHHFRRLGTDRSPGTKTFALTGHVVNTGLIEVPFGSTLRQIIFEIGGGVTDEEGKLNNAGFKAVQIGGPSGGCLTEKELDMALDFDSLTSIGAMIGSGGLVVMNESTCMVQIAKFFMQFTQNESCGKCVLCREGTKQMLALLEDITEGRATHETIELLEVLANAVKAGSLCGLGKTAPNPILSTLKNFKEEYYAHIEQKRCPVNKCLALTDPEILAEKCKGCGACIKVCAVNAISGEKKSMHCIDVNLCVKCGACKSACKFNAVIGV